MQTQAPQMRSGAIQRGEAPSYRNQVAPSGGQIFERAPIFSRLPSYNQPTYNLPAYNPPAYNNGGNNYNNYNNSGGYAFGNGQYGNGAYSGGYVPPIGPGNGFFTHPIPPVGPANGYFSGQAPITGNQPPLLGGYYYGNYCPPGTWRHSYPSVYSIYSGFPQYIYSPNVIVVGTPYTPDYATAYLPFAAPVYQTTYNQNNYYVATPERVQELSAGGETAKTALRHAYPANSYQAAFADIAHAWTDGDIDLVRRHLRDPDTRVSVFLSNKYSYSIASSDFSKITRDALDRLHTVTFSFTRLRKAKNGDVTAFGSHVYQASDTSSGSDSGTVPFDQDGTLDTAAGDTPGAEKTVYVSYTLRRFGTEWDIVATDSAGYDLAATPAK